MMLLKIGQLHKIKLKIKKLNFLKTHQYLGCKINGNSFTNQTNTLGTIYVVRDPRNVVSSIKNHYSKL